MDPTSSRGAEVARTAITIRTASDADHDAIEMLVARLRSERSRTRYHDDALIPRGDEVDAARPARVVVAVTPSGTGERVVGLAYWTPEDELTGRALLAVAEEWRLTDLGQRLVAEMAGRAAATGVRRLVAEILPRNAALRAAARASGLRERRAGTSVEIDITSLA